MRTKLAILATVVTLAVIVGGRLAALGQAPAARPTGPVPTFEAGWLPPDQPTVKRV